MWLRSRNFHSHGSLCGSAISGQQAGGPFGWQEIRKEAMQGISVRPGLSCSKQVLSGAFRKPGPLP